MTGPNDSGRGAMTGATGDLTPDDSDRPFIPAELREISDPGGEAAPDGDLEAAWRRRLRPRREPTATSSSDRDERF